MRPTGSRLDARIEEVNQLLEEVMSIMRGCPPELKLRGGMDSRVQRYEIGHQPRCDCVIRLTIRKNSPSREFARDAEQVLQELFFDPKASREYARDAYLVQAGNIYVNQVRHFVCGRFVSDWLTTGLSQQIAIGTFRSLAIPTRAAFSQKFV